MDHLGFLAWNLELTDQANLPVLPVVAGFNTAIQNSVAPNSRAHELTFMLIRQESKRNNAAIKPPTERQTGAVPVERDRMLTVIIAGFFWMCTRP